MKTSSDNPSSSAAIKRVQWLFQHLFNSDRSAMARKCDLSLTGVINVVTGQQEPGRRFLTALVEHTEANAEWLLTGRGPPLRSGGIPVASNALPGIPDQHTDLLTQQDVVDFTHLYASSRYWLKLRTNDPLLNEPELKLNSGDLLLLETDLAAFSKSEDFDGKFSAFRRQELGLPVIRLAEFKFHEASTDGGPYLLANPYLPGSKAIERIILEKLPNGEWATCKQFLARRPPKSKKGQGATNRLIPYVEPYPAVIQIADIVAVCLMIVRGV